MPDRDKEHTELPPNYQTPYLQLREGQDVEAIVEGFERGLKQSLQHYGNAPVRVLHEARRIIGNASGPLFESDDDIQRETVDKIEHLAARKLDNPRIEEIAARACKAALSPEIGSEWQGKETADSVYYHYVKRLFEVETEGPIRNDPDQHPGKHDEVCQLLDEVKDVLKKDAFSHFARQLRARKDVDDLRVSSTPQIEGSGADLNLTEL